MTADLTARVRAKLDEVKHAPTCSGGQSLAWSHPHLAYYLLPCDCDHPQRVADLVRRMGDKLLWMGHDSSEELERPIFVTVSDICAWEAALAVPVNSESGP